MDVAEEAKKSTNKGERKRLARKRRLEEEAGGNDVHAKGDVHGSGSGEYGTPTPTKQKPKMTYEERRAKFLRPKHSGRQRGQGGGRGASRFAKSNRPGSHKRQAAKMYCYGCRQPGHMLQDCPDVAGAGDGDNAKRRICFNCGSTQHRLAHCTQPLVNGGCNYATCFVCGKRGHLSSQCERNEKGLYPKGGGCHRCGEKDHFAARCPTREGGKETGTEEDGERERQGGQEGADEAAVKEKEYGGTDPSIFKARYVKEKRPWQESMTQEIVFDEQSSQGAKGVYATNTNAAARTLGGDDLHEHDFLLESLDDEDEEGLDSLRGEAVRKAGMSGGRGRGRGRGRGARDSGRYGRMRNSHAPLQGPTSSRSPVEDRKKANKTKPKTVVF